tara:strand:+ start:175 stop:378 length:204 start_codon:yes stop_codon:yes gene_type:complete
MSLRSIITTSDREISNTKLIIDQYGQNDITLMMEDHSNEDCYQVMCFNEKEIDVLINALISVKAILK